MSEEVLLVQPRLIFWKVTEAGIVKYEYLCRFPSRMDDSKYHILINRTSEEPERWYDKRLREVLDQKIFSYEQAKEQHLKLVEKHLLSLKATYHD